MASRSLTGTAPGGSHSDHEAFWQSFLFDVRPALGLGGGGGVSSPRWRALPGSVALALLASVLVLTGPPTPEAGAQSNITVQFDRGDYNAAEGDSAHVKLTFGSATPSQATFAINTTAGTAIAGIDFTAGPHSCTVPSGQTSHVCNVPVLADSQIEDYERFTITLGSLPNGFVSGTTATATVQVVNVSVVPQDWSLKPSGVGPGEQFRLLFKTHNERNSVPNDIGVYDTFVRNRVSGAGTGHADIRQYSSTFRVVGSTPTVDAAWHTATGIMVSGEPSHTPFSTPIYWLNGPKIADDYNDFWDGTWDDNSHGAHRRANGNASTNNRGPNTGTQTGTTHATAGTKRGSNALGTSGTHSRWGGGDPNQNPISQGNIPKGNNNVYIGLSGIFEVDSGDAANPTISIAAVQEKVTEGDTIRFTIRSVPPPTTQKSVSVTVDETTDGGRNFVPASQRGDRTVTVPANTGTVTFTVRTENNDRSERDGGVTVTVNDGTNYDPHDTRNTASTVIESDEEFNELSASVALGNGSTGPAHPGARVVFKFDTGEAQARELSGIRTQLAWSGDVISPRSDHRPTKWDQFWYHPDTGRPGGYVRTGLERTIYRNNTGFDTDIYVKNRQEAGGVVDDGWIAMRSVASGTTSPHPDAEWACMAVGSGTCPSAWPGVPAATVVALDNGRVMSGEDARFRVSVNPAPGTGETKRVYLRTWYRYRRGGGQNQNEAFRHVDVDSSGTATFTMPTRVSREGPGRTARAQVQEDIAYTNNSAYASVETSRFQPSSQPCWYGHTHHAARLITVDGSQEYSPAGMGITECLTSDEIDDWVYGNGSTRNRPTVWTSCKPDYGHREHPYTDGNGNVHLHHNYFPYIKLGNGSCPGGQPQTDGQDSQDGQTDDPPGDPFPEPGAMGFSDVTATTMTLSWSQREVDHYLVYWAENVENADVQSVQVDAGTHSHTLGGLKPGTVYAVIVYSQDYDEVTTTAYQRTAAQAASSCDPNTSSTAIAKARAAFEWHTNYGSDAPLFWRILNSLDADNLPAKPSGVTEETVSAQEVKDFSSGKGWAGWAPIVDAMERCTAAADPDPVPDPVTPDPDPVPDPVTPDPDPEISVAAGAGVTEGGDAIFTVTAVPAPSAPLSVDVSVSQSGDFGVATGSRTVTVGTSGTATLTVSTTDDSADEADGQVTATVDAGSGYTVSQSAGSATVAVADDDDPPPPPPTVNATPSLSISDASAGEGGTLTFTVTLSPASDRYVWVNYYARPAYGAAMSATYADFAQAYGMLTFKPGETAKTVTVAAVDDSSPEDDETFVVSLYSEVQAKVADRTGIGTITDND